MLISHFLMHILLKVPKTTGELAKTQKKLNVGDNVGPRETYLPIGKISRGLKLELVLPLKKIVDFALCRKFFPYIYMHIFRISAAKIYHNQSITQPLYQAFKVRHKISLENLIWKTAALQNSHQTHTALKRLQKSSLNLILGESPRVCSLMDQYLPLDDLRAIELQAGGETVYLYWQNRVRSAFDDRKRLERRRRRAAAAADQQTH
jgi:hypothetical protein